MSTDDLVDAEDALDEGLRRESVLTDGFVVAAALGGAAAAVWAPPFPLIVGVCAAGLAFTSKSRLFLVLAVALLAGGRSHAANEGLRSVVSGPIDEWCTLVDDPRPTAGGIQFVVRDRRGARWSASAAGPVAWSLGKGAAGDDVLVAATTQSWAGAGTTPSRWARSHHVAGRMKIRTFRGRRAGALPWRIANTVRRVMTRGMSHLPARHRGLFAGIVLGDGRLLSPVQKSDFKAAGLTHLMVVSGQNVAFVLALSQPLLQRLGRRNRLFAALAIIAMFGTITRWEPSVLRASMMAALALFARSIGRTVSAVRVLALACCALLIIDPLLVWSAGFALSVAATAGLALAREPIQRALPGPPSARAAVASVLAAQLGVAPLTGSWFGGVALASLPANVVAGLIAGPAMVWGVVAGLLAGLWGGALARLVHIPTSLLLGALDLCAQTSARLPLGRLSPGALAAVFLATAVALALRKRVPVVEMVAGTAALAVLVVSGVSSLSVKASAGVQVGGGVTLWRDGGWRANPPRAVVQLCGARDPGVALDALRLAGVDAISVLIACRGGRQSTSVVLGVASRLPIGKILVPPGTAWVPTIDEKSSVVVDTWEAEVGGTTLVVEAVGDQLRVRAPPRADS